MAKFNNKRNGQKKKNNNSNGYFAKNVKQFGKDFIKSKRDVDIRRDAPRIFKDIAFSMGEVGLIAEFFLDRRFVNQLYIQSTESFMEYDTTSKGLVAYMKDSSNPPFDPKANIENMIQTKTKLAAAYSIIAQALNSILNVLQANKNADRLALYVMIGGILRQLSMQLKDYKYVL